MEKHYIAVDLGATSGRTILASVESDQVKMQEINRFPNHLIQAGSHYYWDIFELYRNILVGLKKVAEMGVKPESIGIDTWGVDFVMVGADGNLLSLPISYRDPHTDGMPERLFKTIPAEKVYDKTGIQVINFNSLFQFYALGINDNSAFRAARYFLFMPDALVYLLTGKKVTEYTIASTGQIVNARTRQLDEELLASVGLTLDQFGKMVYPGERVGELTPEVQSATGLGAVPVVAVGGHDTASAVAATAAETKEFAYLSSGTWSLMGIEVAEPIITEQSQQLNFTNEGGVHRDIRFLKNICGMWLLERCRAEWKDADYGHLLAEAEKAEPFRSLINPDDPCFANPKSMPKAIQEYCRATGQPVPESEGQITRCIYESLALRYRQVMDMLRQMAPFPINTLHIIGGGSRNQMLNQFTANACGMRVVAGPTECTALGNVMVQAGLSRAQIAKCIETTEYQPHDQEVWDAAYQKYLQTTR
ncbi:MAG: rhamnulokinase [Bacteroidales bacterium]|nr:rhamnulokinase [Bacteroidales bacterium]